MNESINLAQDLNIKRIRFLRQIFAALKSANQDPLIETAIEPYAEYQRNSEIIKEHFHKFKVNQDIEIGYLERHSQTGEILFDSIPSDKKHSEKFTLLNFSLHIPYGTIVLYPEINELLKAFNYQGLRPVKAHAYLSKNHDREDHLYSFWKHSFDSTQALRFIPSTELKKQGVKEFSINDSIATKFMEEILFRFEAMDSYFIRLEQKRMKVLQKQDHKEVEQEYTKQIKLIKSVSNSLLVLST